MGSRSIHLWISVILFGVWWRLLTCQCPNNPYHHCHHHGTFSFWFNGLVCLSNLCMEKVVEAVAWVSFLQPRIFWMLVRPQFHILTGFSRTWQTTIKGYYINLLNGSNSHCWKSNLYINLMVFSWCTHYRKVMRALMSVLIQITIFHSPTNLGKFSGYPLPQGLQAARPNPEVMRTFLFFVV